jgi:hypothetical protein
MRPSRLYQLPCILGLYLLGLLACPAMSKMITLMMEVYIQDIFFPTKEITY